MNDEQPIAKVTHFFNKINVAVIEVVDGEIKVGETVTFRGRGIEFSQEVQSLQMEHENVDAIKKGDSAGLKVDQPVKEGDLVYLAG